MEIITEKKDWRKKLSSFPEPFPFHLDQLKILEFEFLSPENNNFQEKEDTL